MLNKKTMIQVENEMESNIERIKRHEYNNGLWNKWQDEKRVHSIKLVLRDTLAVTYKYGGK